MTTVMMEILTDQRRRLLASVNAANDLAKAFTAFGKAAQEAADATSRFAGAQRLGRKRGDAIAIYRRRKGIRRKGGNFE